jgi:hypothetical protein
LTINERSPSQQPQNVDSILKKRKKYETQGEIEEESISQEPKKIRKGTRTRNHPHFVEPKQTIQIRRLIIIDMKGRIKNREV